MALPIEHPSNASSRAIQTQLRRMPFRALGMLIALDLLVAEIITCWRFIQAQPPGHGFLAETDFIDWLAATRLIASGQGSQLFNSVAHQAAQAALVAPYVTPPQNTLVYHYWPVLGGLLLPLVGWAPEAALAFFAVLSSIAFTAAIVALVRGMHMSRPDALLFGLTAWSFWPHIVDLEQGQWSNLLCLPLALSLLALQRRQDWRAGMWLGLLLLKPQFIPVWAVALLVSGRWRALAGLSSTGVILVAASTIISGPGWFGAWLRISQSSVSATQGHGFQAFYSHNFRQLFGLLPGVGPEGANALQDGLAVLLALGVGVLWWRIRRLPLHSETGGLLLALTTLAMLLSAPVLGSHDLTFWVVGAAFLPLGNPRQPFWKLCWVGWLTSIGAIFMLVQSPIKFAALFMVIACGMLLIAILRGVPARASGDDCFPRMEVQVTA
jgi:hypothetical protein